MASDDDRSGGIIPADALRRFRVIKQSSTVESFDTAEEARAYIENQRDRLETRYELSDGPGRKRPSGHRKQQAPLCIDAPAQMRVFKRGLGEKINRAAGESHERFVQSEV